MSTRSAMQEKYKHKNRLLDTSSDKNVMNWHELLNLQTDIFLPFEIGLLYDTYDWEVSTSILDIGCGNGYFTKQLSDQFPEKQFTAIDISSELIKTAQEHNASSRITYKQDDLFKFETIEPYEVIVMRLIVQHLGDFKKILDRAHDLLVPGGSLIILDANHHKMYNFPKLPKFYSLLDELEALSQRNKTNKCLTHRWGEMIMTSKGWSLVEQQDLDIPIIHAGMNKNVLRIYDLWLDIIESANEVSINFDEIRSEIRAWSKEPNAFAQFGLYFMHIVKNDQNRHVVYV